MEIISDKNNSIIAMLFRVSYSPEKTEFYTPDSFSQQLGIIKYPKNHFIKAHYHNTVHRNIELTQEVLLIRKGKVKASLYGRDLQHVIDVYLNQGDVILLASGGHGFEMLEDSEMLEVKQGPYSGIGDDKTVF